MAKKRSGTRRAGTPDAALARMQTPAGQREVVLENRRDPNPAGPDACGIPNPPDCSNPRNCRFGNRGVLSFSPYLKSLIRANLAAGMSPAAAERDARVRCEVQKTNIILERRFDYPARPLPTMADWVAKGTATHQP